MSRLLLAFCAGLLVACCESVPADEPSRSGLQTLPNCRLVPTDWADGDSFLIRTEAGKELTLRLYGADCIEWHVNDDTDARRLRTQRRYFGIVDATPEQAMAKARSMGEAAGRFTRDALAQPFTVHTAYADALGDGRHQRFYGFVTTADGQDLSTLLVRAGLARAFGVWRATPDGASHIELRERLRDLELQAARAGLGAWAMTDWSQLPAERAAQRAEDRELDVTKGLDPQVAGLRVDVNTAARDELMRLPGIGETMANRITQHRPYRSPDDLLRVQGIGTQTLQRMREFLAATPAAR